MNCWRDSHYPSLPSAACRKQRGSQQAKKQRAGKESPTANSCIVEEAQTSHFDRTGPTTCQARGRQVDTCTRTQNSEIGKYSKEDRQQRLVLTGKSTVILEMEA